MEPYDAFRRGLKRDFSSKISDLQAQIDPVNHLKMDFHCHDRNSDTPDELWGRILGIPETWLKTSGLIKVLKRNGVSAYTITNHNNARSCWELKDKGFDILSGAEFTCHFEEFNAYIHVLAYGFTPEQEAKLLRYRKDIRRFCAYANEENIPTVLPHPTYLYFRHQRTSTAILEKLALLFERFEVLNGQRDIWQNLLTLTWLEGLGEEGIVALENKHGLKKADFCRHPYEIRFTGGTDDHMGIFAGNCGTMIEVPDLERRQKELPVSELALAGIRNGRMAPYGHLGNVSEKLNVAFLDYFCQVALNMEDPGIVRMMLHRGKSRDKAFCFAIANGIMELRRHKNTMAFMNTLHKAIRGKKPNALKKMFVSKAYRPIFDQVVKVSKANQGLPEEHIVAMREMVESIYRQLLKIIVDRFSSKIDQKSALELTEKSWGDVLNRLEVPAHVRSMFDGGDLGGHKMSSLSLGHAFDRMSFPLLGSAVLQASTFTSTRVMFNSRRLLNDLASDIQSYEHPKKILWLTDTLEDKNGVSTFLQQVLDLVRKENLPIDFLTCGNEARTEPHLHVVEEMCSFNLPHSGDLRMRIPNLMEVQNIFYEGAYDRIVCSTDLMGWVALYLKTAFSVPAYFYMHTDWMDFFQRSVHLEKEAMGRIRRYLRFFYKRFDGVFILNEDHRKWLTGRDMALAEEKVLKTAHWVHESYCTDLQKRASAPPVAIFVGRLSEEKGVLEIPAIAEGLASKGVECQWVFAGDGPSRTLLENQMPQASFLGWQSREELLALYQRASVLVLPSRFDTFGCVVLEAMSCSCPVVAYDCKGPKEIIESGVSGFLSDSQGEMVDQLAQVLLDREVLERLSRGAHERSSEYQSGRVMGQLLASLGMPSSLDRDQVLAK